MPSPSPSPPPISRELRSHLGSITVPGGPPLSTAELRLVSPGSGLSRKVKPGCGGFGSRQACAFERMRGPPGGQQASEDWRVLLRRLRIRSDHVTTPTPHMPVQLGWRLQRSAASCSAGGRQGIRNTHSKRKVRAWWVEAPAAKPIWVQLLSALPFHPPLGSTPRSFTPAHRTMRKQAPGWPTRTNTPNNTQTLTRTSRLASTRQKSRRVESGHSLLGMS